MQITPSVHFGIVSSQQPTTGKYLSFHTQGQGFRYVQNGPNDTDMTDLRRAREAQAPPRIVVSDNRQTTLAATSDDREAGQALAALMAQLEAKVDAHLKS